MNNKKRPDIIEFIGPPGSGKSTVASDLSRQFIKRGYRCTPAIETPQARNILENKDLPEYLRRLTGIVSTLITSPKKSLMAYLLAAEVNPTNITNIARAYNLILHKVVEEKLCRQEDLDLVVLPEGSLHLMCILSVNGQIPSIHRYQSLYSQDKPCKKHIINVKTPVDVCVKRIDNRVTGSRFDERNEGENRKMIQQYNSCLNRTLRLTEMSTTNVDGTKSPRTIVSSILQTIGI